MKTDIFNKVKERITGWQVGAIPGITVVGLAILARATGLLQSLEWGAFDYFLRLRPTETVDERVTIVGINQADISRTKAYPIPDREIAVLLQKVQAHKPRAIGLDLIRDKPVEPGHQELIKQLKNSKNLIGIEKVLPVTFPPPPILSPEQIGFSDAILDTDGRLRRSLLGTPTTQGYKYSLTLQLARAYLASEKIFLTNSKRDRHAMQLGDTELPRFLANSGGYANADAGGVQMLLNFRSGDRRFPVISLNEIKTGQFDPKLLRDRIVIIGVTAPGVDIINTYATTGLDRMNGQVYGVEIQAHAVSQLLSAVLDRRPLLQVWADAWEYLWIIAWGFLGIVLGKLTQSPTKNLFAVGLSSIALLGISYLLLMWGWWIPVVPALFGILVLGTTAVAFYQRDRTLKARIQERQFIIENSFTSIHNGPLQSLASLLRLVREQDLPQEQLITKLEQLNHEIRDVYEILQQEPLAEDSSLYLNKSLAIDVQAPLRELLYQVYCSTLERDFPCFKTLKVKIQKFDPVEDPRLNLTQKKELCRFLEEALCNVGKHAVGVTRLSVTFTQKEELYILQITDNGAGIASKSTEGRGTQQSRNLARQLGGEFQRSPLPPRGTLCQLTWRTAKLRKLVIGNW